MRFLVLNQRGERVHKISEFRAKQNVAQGRAEWVDDKTIRYLTPTAQRPQEDRQNLLNGGSMRDTWHVEESAGYFVMQMRSVNPEENVGN